jgi:hypothetical protein
MNIAHNTIKLKKYSDVIEEHKAGGAIYPGMLLIMSAEDTVIAHNDNDPAAFCTMVALEDELQGKGIDDPYVTGDQVQVWIPYRGDWVYAIAEDGTNYTVGSFVASAGNGYVKAFSSGEAFGVVVKAINLSGSSGAEDSEAPFGYNKRIMIRVL